MLATTLRTTPLPSSRGSRAGRWSTLSPARRFRERQQRSLDGARAIAKQAQDRLEQIGVTANRNAVPFDPRPPMVSSGVRIGTPALASRGLDVAEFRLLGELIREALTGDFEAAG